MRQTLKMRMNNVTRNDIPSAKVKKTLPGIPMPRGETPKPAIKPRKASIMMGTPTRYSFKNLPEEKF